MWLENFVKAVKSLNRVVFSFKKWCRFKTNNDEKTITDEKKNHILILPENLNFSNLYESSANATTNNSLDE